MTPFFRSVSPVLESMQGSPTASRNRGRSPGLPRGKGLPLLLLAASIAMVAGCGARPGMEFRPRSYAYPVPPGVTFDMTEGRAIPRQRLLERLAGRGLLFVGEHHTDPRSHRFQREILELLVEQKRQVTVALEMLPRSANAALEQWRKGELEEADFLEAAQWYSYWQFPWAHYRDIFLLLRRHRIPIRGVNAEHATRAAVREGTLAKLPASLREELGDLKAETRPHSLHLFDALDAAGHGGGITLDSERFQGYRRVQWMWDRLMGVRTAALAAGTPRNPKAPHRGIVVVLIGSGHLAYQLGAHLQAARAGATPLSIWDEVLTEPPPPAGHPVPVGISGLVRVYPPLEKSVDFPRLRGVMLEKAPKGVMVKTVHGAPIPGQPALKAGDLLTAIEGKTLGSPAALHLALESQPFGKPVKLEIMRAGKKTTLSFVPRRPPER